MGLTARQSITTAGSSPLNLTYGSAVTGTNPCVAMVACGSGVPSSVLDSVNGSMVSFASAYDSLLGIYFSFWWLKNSSGTSGTPTVTVTAPGYITALSLVEVQGFVGTPTVDANFNGGVTFDASATTTVSCSPLSTNFNNEMMLAIGRAPASFSTYNYTLSGSNYGAFYQPYATAASNAAFTGTLASSGNWALFFAAIYDNPAAAVPGPLYHRRSTLYFI